MKLYFAKGGCTRYLCAKLGRKELLNPQEVDLLTMGSVPCLIPLSSMQGKRNNIMQYDISDYSTLRFYCTCILNREQMLSVLEQCVNMFRQTQAAYLKHANLVLDFEKIFVTLQAKTLHFVYLPVLGYSQDCSVPAFFRQLLEEMIGNTHELLDIKDRCLAYLNGPEPFSLSRLLLIMSVRPEPSAGARQVRQATPGAQFAAPSGGRTVLRAEDDPATILLDGRDAKRAYGYLVRIKTQEYIRLDKPLFRIGREAGSVDYCIRDNDAISRCHANVIHTVKDFFLVDCGSANKTYVDGKAIDPNAEVLLTDGMRLKLADEEFEFLMNDRGNDEIGENA